MSVKSEIRKIKKELGLVTHINELPMFNMDSIHEAYETGNDPVPSWWIPDTLENRKIKWELEHPWEIDREALRRNPENED